MEIVVNVGQDGELGPNTLTTSHMGKTYQWFVCPDGNSKGGLTKNMFKIRPAGKYPEQRFPNLTSLLYRRVMLASKKDKTPNPSQDTFTKTNTWTSACKRLRRLLLDRRKQRAMQAKRYKTVKAKLEKKRANYLNALEAKMRKNKDTTFHDISPSISTSSSSTPRKGTVAKRDKIVKKKQSKAWPIKHWTNLCSEIKEHDTTLKELSDSELKEKALKGSESAERVLRWRLASGRLYGHKSFDTRILPQGCTPQDMSKPCQDTSFIKRDVWAKITSHVMRKHRFDFLSKYPKKSFYSLEVDKRIAPCRPDVVSHVRVEPRRERSKLGSTPRRLSGSQRISIDDIRLLDETTSLHGNQRTVSSRTTLCAPDVVIQFRGELMKETSKSVSAHKRSCRSQRPLVDVTRFPEETSLHNDCSNEDGKIAFSRPDVLPHLEAGSRKGLCALGHAPQRSARSQRPIDDDPRSPEETKTTHRSRKNVTFLGDLTGGVDYTRDKSDGGVPCCAGAKNNSTEGINLDRPFPADVCCPRIPNYSPVLICLPKSRMGSTGNNSRREGTDDIKRRDAPVDGTHVSGHKLKSSVDNVHCSPTKESKVRRKRQISDFASGQLNVSEEKYSAVHIPASSVVRVLSRGEREVRAVESVLFRPYWGCEKRTGQSRWWDTAALEDCSGNRSRVIPIKSSVEICTPSGEIFDIEPGTTDTLEHLGTVSGHNAESLPGMEHETKTSCFSDKQPFVVIEEDSYPKNCSTGYRLSRKSPVTAKCFARIDPKTNSNDRRKSGIKSVYPNAESADAEYQTRCNLDSTNGGNNTARVKKNRKNGFVFTEKILIRSCRQRDGRVVNRD